MRSGEWKLVSAYDYTAKKFKAWELYDLKTDRSELKDLSGKYPEQTKQMIGQYNQWSERVGVVPREILDKIK
jgi:arylsulfatase